MRATNPATGEVIREYPEDTAAAVERKLALAAEAFAVWSCASFGERAAGMHRAAAILRDRRDVYARLMTAEVGKTLAASEAEVEKCAWVCDFYADNAAQQLAPAPQATDASESGVRFEPLGAVLAVMPWNFPFWQVFRFAAPGLMAGNVGLLKHASNVPGCALAIEEVFRLAGFPEGAFQTLLIGARAVEAVIRHPVVRAVTLTGSEPAGRMVAAQAGDALKKTVLELGGSDPFIVLRDADPVEVAAAAVAGRCINNGQSCIAAKRFIVEEPVADAFTAAFVARMRTLRVGDPMDRATDVGPLAREDLLDEVHGQVTRSVAAGARLLCGGERLPRPGWFYAPTVLGEVTAGMPAFDEETFGPVAPVIRARDAADAVALANRSRFGLGASLWTRDVARARELVPSIQSGSVFVNGNVKSDPRLPFGGVKDSGYGRELSAFGIREFVNIKTVWIR
ncbi:MAG: NAD-dependent succinate-semialdehyde dehydrogenase [Deltaproteobacteria bacterium]|nr:NAD-dependent succinate-semialdehyde dehydrogenase [Deltaproteobacteria bacterium]